MVIGVLLLCVLAAFGPGGCALAALAAAASVFADAFAPGLSWSQLLLIDALVAAVPLAAYLAGAMVEHVIEIRGREQLLAPAAMTVAFALQLSSPALPAFTQAALAAVRGPAGVAQGAALLWAAGGAALFCAAAVALVMSATVLVFELGARWMLSAGSAQFSVSFSSLRLLLILAVAGFSSNLVVGLFSHELWPATIAAALGR